MMVQSGVWALLACLFVAGEPAEDPDRHVTIRGTTYEIYPPEKLRARGFPVTDLPREENAAFLYIDAINMLGPEEAELPISEAAAGEWPDGEAGERLNAYLESQQPVLDLARAASRMPDYHLPLFCGETDALINAVLPALRHQRQLARLLAADAHRQARAGNHAGAIDRLLAAQRMGHQLAHGTTMIEGLVGIAIGQLSSDQLLMIAAAHDMDPTLLRAASDEMEVLAADMPTIDDMMRGEEMFSLTMMDDVVESPGTLGLVTGEGFFGPMARVDPDDGWHKLMVALRRVYLPDRAVKRHVRTYFDRLRSVSRRKEGGEGIILEEAALIAEVPAWDVLTRSTLPSIGRIYESNLRYRSNHERARLRLAIMAYQRETGALPPSLDALAPLYITAVPIDPMTGYDFEYRPTMLASGAPAGLDPVTSENEEALRQKRRTPAILTPRASKWRRHVLAFADQYQLDDAQRNAADAILRDMEARAARFEKAHAARIQELLAAGNTESARGAMEPLDKLFEELQQRLDRLPTAGQRAAASEISETP